MTRHKLDVQALYHAMDAVRAHRRMSWRDVARETGISPSTLTRLGQGHSPDADGLCSVLAWLGLPLDRFTVAR
jgi:transcriptional regulator with XRE-family HTH domain